MATPTKWSAVKDFGVASETNLRWRKSMEDTHVFRDKFGSDRSAFLAIYDGHGGKEVADLAASRLHDILLHEVQTSGEPNMRNCLETAFRKMDDEVSAAGIGYAGATVVIGYIQDKPEGRTLWVANAGDARAVISRDGTAERLSYDHKSTDEGEIKRVNEAGGCVVLNRVQGVLAVTRAFGDHSLKPSVVPTPFITETPLKESDKVLVLACDGLWDVCEDSTSIADIEGMPAQQAAEFLVRLALDKGSRDNISVMVVNL
eukprot:JP446369.1.p1 GENE.JP446369.1~~JP446369.1.p1  ORF type:complete len:259 (+),score=35.19 JP446369.1:30-806(+)